MKNKKNLIYIIIGVVTLLIIATTIVLIVINNKKNDTVDSLSEPESEVAEELHYDITTVGTISGMGTSAYGNSVTFSEDLPTVTEVPGKNEYKNYTFYIADTNEDADVIYNYFKDSYNIVDNEDNWFTGYDKNALNISIKKYYYKNANLIVCHNDYISDPGSTANEPSSTKAQNDKIHEKITQTW